MRRSIVSSATLAAAAALALLGAGGASADGRFSCRASAVRVVLLGVPVEPVVANPAGDPCTTATVGDPPAGSAPGLTIAGARAQTDADGSASADVADVGIDLVPGLVVSLHGLHAEFTRRCSTEVRTPPSPLPGLRINGVEVLLPDSGTPVDLDLGLVAVHLNQTRVSGRGDLVEVTRRAAVIESPLLATEIVLAEATAGMAGDPCARFVPFVPPPPAPPPIAVPRPFGPVAGIVAGVTAGGCAGRPFLASVVGRDVAASALTLDDRLVGRAGAVTVASFRIDPARLRIGSHRLRAVVSFTATRPTTSRFAFVRCGALIPAAAPTGGCVPIRVSAGRGEVVAAAVVGPGGKRLFAGRLATFARPSTRTLCLRIPGRASGVPVSARSVRVTVRVGGERFARDVRLA